MGRPRKDQSKHPNAAPSSAVTGADTAEELRLQAEAAEAAALLGRKAPRGDSSSTTRKRQELIAEATTLREQRESMLGLCKALAPVPFEAIGMTLGDPRWGAYVHRPAFASDPTRPEQIIQSRADLIADAYARACAAWGFDFTGKWTALSMVLLVNVRIGSMIAAEIAQETPPAIKPEKEKDEPLYTPDRPA